MADWYRDHPLGPEHYSEAEYLDWCQDQGLAVDASGNVQYGGTEYPPGADPDLY